MHYVYPNIFVAQSSQTKNAIKGALFLGAIMLMIGGFFVAGMLSNANATHSESPIRCYQTAQGVECGFRE